MTFWLDDDASKTIQYLVGCNVASWFIEVAGHLVQLLKDHGGSSPYAMVFLNVCQVRGILAQLGFEKLDDIIGRTDILKPRDISLMKTQHLDLSYILAVCSVPFLIVYSYAGFFTSTLQVVFFFLLGVKSSPFISRVPVYQQ